MAWVKTPRKLSAAQEKQGNQYQVQKHAQKYRRPLDPHQLTFIAQREGFDVAPA